MTHRVRLRSTNLEILYGKVGECSKNQEVQASQFSTVLSSSKLDLETWESLGIWICKLGRYALETIKLYVKNKEILEYNHICVCVCVCVLEKFVP